MHLVVIWYKPLSNLVKLFDKYDKAIILYDNILIYGMILQFFQQWEQIAKLLILNLNFLWAVNDISFSLHSSLI